MANPHKGEVAFEVEDASYTLRFSANALCELEDALDMGMSAIAEQLSDASKLRLKTVRAVLWAGLRDHHSGVSLEEAGNLVTALTLPGALDLIGRGMTAAFPETKASLNPPQKPGPVTGPAGTGRDSSVNGASSASLTKPSGGERRATSSPTSPPTRSS